MLLHYKEMKVTRIASYLLLFTGVFFCLTQVSNADTNSLNVNCTTTVQTSKGSLCLWVMKDVKTWEEADEDCAKYGGYLLAVTSAEMNKVVTEMMKNNSISTLWLGLREIMSTWRWLSSGEEVFHQGCFQEDPDDRELDEKFTLVNNSYSACNSRCLNAGKKYAGLQTESECWCGDSFGRHGYGDCNLLCNDRIQVCGGIRDGMISNYINAPEGGFSDWERGQPNNHQLYQTCAVMDDYNGYQWNDLKCTEPSGVICELAISREACLNNSYHYNETWGCFIVSNHSMTFFDGLTYCNDMGGRLLEVDSQEKRNFYIDRVLLQDTFTPTAFFIGLVRGEWVWSTDEKLVYSSWGQGWPNGKDQNCAIIDVDGLWNDVTCSAPYSYICQKGSSPRSTTPPITTPTTTTPRPTPKPCDAACQNRIKEIKKAIADKEKIVYYGLIGGGALLAIIIIICTICTVICIKNHYRRKKEKRFDYFFGVDVSRPEDEKEFKSSKDIKDGSSTVLSTKSKTETSSIVEGDTLDKDPTSADDTPVLQEQNGAVVTSSGIDNASYVPSETSAYTPLVVDQESNSEENKDVAPESEASNVEEDIAVVSEVSPGGSEAPSNPDDVSDASTAQIGEAEDKILLPGSSDMTNYDYNKPDPSQMIY